MATLVDIRTSMKRGVERVQRGKLASFRGKRIMRAGKVSVVKKAARSGVTLTMEATGDDVKMTSRGFLSRGVVVLPDDPALDHKLKPTPMPQRAHGIAVASELSGESKILMLLRLKKEANAEGKEAIDWYVAQIKTGGKVKRWIPQEDSDG